MGAFAILVKWVKTVMNDDQVMGDEVMERSN